jgi:UDP-3-O-acyl-N-acetylglucosamine deacetylase
MWMSADTFVRQLAPARSFLLEQEAAELRRRGLGSHVTYQDILVFGPEGPLDNHLRFPDECVRHKLLDLVGDLALCGADIHGRIIAHRSGHRLNARMVERLCRTCSVHRHVRAA